ncbi:MAG: EAL domain-containing protein [Eubacteriales bacterium]|nr:EAL domain-containing protein [Eubacteriales bacterium]
MRGTLTTREFELQQGLLGALERKELVMFYQPQIPIQSGQEGKHRAEVLIRWIRDGQIYAMPGEFIPLFEQQKQIAKLDYYVLEETCARLKRIENASGYRIALAVNISRQTAEQPGFFEFCSSCCKRYGLSEKALELEFTEGEIISDYQKFSLLLEQLKGHGFRCAMDDFGSGQSSILELQKLEFDVLKLDRMFFADDASKERQMVILENVIAMAKMLHMEVVAEGIEKSTWVKHLRRLGCDYIQGFLYSQPLNELAYMDWIEKNRYRKSLYSEP